MSNFKNRITEDDDWRDGMNAYRRWTDKEISLIINRIHDLEVFCERFKKVFDYYEEAHQRNMREQEKIQGEIL